MSPKRQAGECAKRRPEKENVRAVSARTQLSTGVSVAEDENLSRGIFNFFELRGNFAARPSSNGNKLRAF